VSGRDPHVAEHPGRIAAKAGHGLTDVADGTVAVVITQAGLQKQTPSTSAST
jgi:hypothetical protein